MYRLIVMFFIMSLAFVTPAMGQTVEDEALSEANDPNLGIPTVGMTVTLPRHDGTVAKGKARADAQLPEIVDSTQLLGVAQVRVTRIDDNRRVFVMLLVKTGTNTYTVRDVNEYDYNNSGTGGNFVRKTSDQVACAAGGSVTVATGVAIKRQGNTTVPWDRSEEVTYSLSDC